MIRIKKILIRNFKGVKSQIIIDLNKSGFNNQILSGPNGFGKTTIFEALELCISGKFDRIRPIIDVQLKNKGRIKPFFQNTDGENVTIKLLVEKDNVEYVIIKHYDDVHSPSRITLSKDFLPEEAHDTFTTYLSTLSENFESNNIIENEKVTTKQINEFFLGDGSDIDLSNVYYLFNYIQQENSTRFLKLREDYKGSSLSFLFNIEKEEVELQKLEELSKKFEAQKTTITTEIQSLESIESNSETFEYIHIFEHQEFDFDKIDPYQNLTDANLKLSQYNDTLNELIQFKNNFDPKEFKKYQVFRAVNEDILNDSNLLNSILVSKIYNPALIDQLNLKNATIVRYNQLLELADDRFMSKETVEELLDENQIKSYEDLKIQINTIDEDLGSVGMIISNLVESNEKVWKHFNEASEKGQLDKNHCPLCSSTFKDFDELTTSYEKQIQKLKAFNLEKIDSKQRLIGQLKEFHQIVNAKIQGYLSNNKKSEDQVLSLIRNYPNFSDKISTVSNRFLTADFNFDENLLFEQLPTSLLDFEIKRNTLKSFLQSNVLTVYNYNESKINGKELFKQYFNDDIEALEIVSSEMLEQKKLFIQFKYRTLSNQRITFLKDRLAKINIVCSKLNILYYKTYRVIKDYKIDMIEKIKIPFFLYSGKILQNYQQGFGIFIDITTTNQKNNIVLKTGNDSDHDVVFHLSSGQMAVVSLAFCLSLNKVYNTNVGFKLLAIDDPIQTMDNLNIHSFIELLRNEFSEYQIILSTHDDFISRYMSYKFEKYGMNAGIQNIQDLVLEQTLTQ
jgi:exonuclease SbcC